jgi:hypothetical protein
MSNARLRLRVLPWFAVLIPATYVLNLWVEAGVSIMAIIRALSIVAGAAALLTLLIALITRRLQLAGVAVLLVFGVLMSRGPLYAAAVIVIAVASFLAVVIWGRIKGQRPTWEQAGQALNTFAIVVFVVVAAGGVTGGSFGAIPDDLRQGTPSLERSGMPQADVPPDIYVLLLDGYPRSDWFERLFGGDNSEFLEGLRERGFDVAERSSSNYMFTELTLTSMLNMAAMPDVEGVREIIAGEVTDHTKLRQVLNENRAFSFLRSHGYRIVSSSPGYEHVSLRRADVYLDNGEFNDFEYHLVRYTVLQWLTNRVAPDFFGDQQRARIRSSFAHASEAIGDAGPPTFAFIHIPAPHPPIVFDAAGGRAAPPASGDVFQQAHSLDDLDAVAYSAQVEFLDGETLRALDTAMSARGDAPPPVLIVMSDHGAAPRPQVSEGQGGPEHYANLFAATTPGHPGLFPDDVSPVNVFPILFNAYFDTDLALLPNGIYAWDSTTGTTAP